MCLPRDTEEVGNTWFGWSGLFPYYQIPQRMMILDSALQACERRIVTSSYRRKKLPTHTQSHTISLNQREMTIGHTLALSRVCAAVGSRRLGDQLIMRSVCRARGALLLNSHKHGNQPNLRGPHALQPAATRSFETTQEMPATRHFGHPTQHSKYSQRNSFTVHPSIRSQFGELGPFFSHPLFRACLHRIRAHDARRTTVFDAREKEKKKKKQGLSDRSYCSVVVVRSLVAWTQARSAPGETGFFRCPFSFLPYLHS